MRALICLLGLWACRAPFAPSSVTRLTPNAVTDSAAAMALACGTRFGLQPLRTYAKLRLWILPGRSFTLSGKLSADNDLEASGYGTGRDVYVSHGYAYLVKLWAHEFLHSLFGLPGNAPRGIPHDPVFAACDLLQF